MTSNIGAEATSGNIGFFAESGITSLEKELKKHFRVEFINRIDEIIAFNRLSLDDMVKITSIKINCIIERLKSFPIELFISESVINHIANQAIKKNLGARPIDRIIAKDIEAPIARLLSEKSSGIRKVRFEIDNDTISMIKLCPQLQD